MRTNNFGILSAIFTLLSPTRVYLESGGVGAGATLCPCPKAEHPNSPLIGVGGVGGTFRTIHSLNTKAVSFPWNVEQSI